MHKIIIFIIILFLISNVSASCNETQININTASLEELDKIVNIGPARAQQIISLRPFESVDGLIDVVGIGNATLEEIKSQGLACVNDETKDTGENTSQKIVKAKETITPPRLK